MTKMNKDNANKNALEAGRIKRRSILKAGAVIAPLALTLHGGTSLAFAGSVNCLAELETHVKVPNFEPDGMGGFAWNGTTTPFDPIDEGHFTGRLNPDGSLESHWDYLINEELYGASCIQSIQMQNIR